MGNPQVRYVIARQTWPAWLQTIMKIRTYQPDKKTDLMSVAMIAQDL